MQQIPNTILPVCPGSQNHSSKSIIVSLVNWETTPTWYHRACVLQPLVGEKAPKSKPWVLSVSSSELGLYLTSVDPSYPVTGVMHMVFPKTFRQYASSHGSKGRHTTL